MDPRAFSQSHAHPRRRALSRQWPKYQPHAVGRLTPSVPPARLEAPSSPTPLEDGGSQPRPPRASRLPWVFAAVSLAAMGGYVALSVEGPAPQGEPATDRKGARDAAGAVVARVAHPTAQTAQAPASVARTTRLTPGQDALARTAEEAPPAGDAPDPEAAASADEASPTTAGETEAEATPPVVTAAPVTLGARVGSPATSAEAAARLFAAGKKQLDDGRARAALARFKKAVVRTPKNPDAWFGLALARTDLRQGLLAGRAAERALKLNPSHAGATLLLAFLAQQRHDVAASKKLYAKYLELEPDGPFTSEVKSVIAQWP